MFVYLYLRAYVFIEGSLEVKLPTMWTDGKAEVGRVREEKRKSEKTEDAGARKGRKVAIQHVFPMICIASKSRLAQAVGAEPFGQIGDEKNRASVARSTFRSQNVQNTSWSDHFSKLRYRKARHCGAKHISKSNCAKHTPFKARLEVAMSKKCTPLWREARFEVKSVKN